MKYICLLGFLLTAGCTTVADAVYPYKEPTAQCKYEDSTPIAQLNLVFEKDGKAENELP